MNQKPYAEFTNQYLHFLDEKGRLTVPVDFRTQLAREQPTDAGFWATAGLDGCLFLFTHLGWNAFKNSFSNSPLQGRAARSVQRMFFGNAKYLEIDRSGRILIPENLRRFAHIQEQALLVGVLHRVEIWSPERYADAMEDVTENFEQVAESALGTIGAQLQSKPDESSHDV